MSHILLEKGKIYNPWYIIAYKLNKDSHLQSICNSSFFITFVSCTIPRWGVTSFLCHPLSCNWNQLTLNWILPWRWKILLFERTFCNYLFCNHTAKIHNILKVLKICLNSTFWNEGRKPDGEIHNIPKANQKEICWRSI